MAEIALTAMDAAHVGAEEVSPESKAEKNRREMPNVAEVIDTFREWFPNLKVIGAEDKETGKKAGEDL